VLGAQVSTVIRSATRYWIAMADFPTLLSASTISGFVDFVFEFVTAKQIRPPPTAFLPRVPEMR